MRTVRRELHAGSTPVILVGLLLVIFLLGQTAQEPTQQQVTTMFVFVVAVVGLYVFVGNTGVTSFGHVSFMAVGGYVGAILGLSELSKKLLLPDIPDAVQSLTVDPMLAVLAGGVVAALVSIPFAGPLMRLNGIAAAISLLALLIIVNVVFRETDAWTRGEKALSAIPLATTMGNGVAWAIGAVALAYAYQRSRWGLKAKATREDELAAAAAGIRIAPQRLLALVPSAFLMGCAGALYAFLIGTVNPDTFYIRLTVLTLVMLIVGGTRSLTGAVTGTIAIFALSEALRRLEEGPEIAFFTLPERPGLELVGLSLTALVILLLRPAGLSGGRELTAQAVARAFRRASSRIAPARADG